MLIHPWDRAVDDDQWRAFLRSAGFGHLVAVGAGRDRAVIVPTQYVVVDNAVRLHLAKANPIWAALAENPVVTLSVAGDWAYIPGAWKTIAGEDPTMGIPTTYYAAVQLTGPARLTASDHELAGLLTDQLAGLEPDSGHAPVEAHQKRFAAIRGITLELSEMDVAAKFKYGGNVDVAHRQAVYERLQGRGGPGDGAAATHVAESIHATGPEAGE